jgi:hypothetical protein
MCVGPLPLEIEPVMGYTLVSSVMLRCGWDTPQAGTGNVITGASLLKCSGEVVVGMIPLSPRE